MTHDDPITIRVRIWTWLIAGWIGLLALGLGCHATGMTVVLGWDAVASSNISGYRIYQGGASMTYTSTVTVGLQTTGVVTGLPPGTSNYFAATTLASNGLESGYSAEIEYTLPPDTNLYDTNFSWLVVRQITVQTDSIYWKVGPYWTNVPGDGRSAYFRLLSTTNNWWQCQSSGSMTTGWTNYPYTVASYRQPRLGYWTVLSNCIATNITTNGADPGTNGLPPPA